MKTIDQHNKQVFTLKENKRATDIKCPSCQKELFYENDNMLMTNPPQKNVRCLDLDCNYTDRVWV